MHTFINELSFVGQCTHAENATELMRQLIMTLWQTEPIRNDEPIRTHSSLYSMKLTPDLSVYDWLMTLSEPLVRRRFTVITKGPFIDTLLEEILDFYECKYQETDVSDHSIACAIHFDGCLISLQGAEGFDQTVVDAKFRQDEGDLINHSIPNLILPDDIWTVRRRYEYNPKHPRQGSPKIIGGNQISIMDLSDEEAQIVLDQGVAYGERQVYGIWNGKFYSFYPHRENLYHGYSVERDEVPEAIVRDLENRV